MTPKQLLQKINRNKREILKKKTIAIKEAHEAKIALLLSSSVAKNLEQAKKQAGNWGIWMDILDPENKIGESYKKAIDKIEKEEAQLNQEIELEKILVKKPDSFFPTPSEITSALLDVLSVHFDGRTNIVVIDPQMGHGGILNLVKEMFPQVTTMGYEINYDLAQLAILNGHEHLGYNFLEEPLLTEESECLKGKEVWIISNPPYERGIMQAHITRSIQLMNSVKAAEFCALLPASSVKAVKTEGADLLDIYPTMFDKEDWNRSKDWFKSAETKRTFNGQTVWYRFTRKQPSREDRMPYPIHEYKLMIENDFQEYKRLSEKPQTEIAVWEMLNRIYAPVPLDTITKELLESLVVEF